MEKIGIKEACSLLTICRGGDVKGTADELMWWMNNFKISLDQIGTTHAEVEGFIHSARIIEAKRELTFCRNYVRSGHPSHLWFLMEWFNLTCQELGTTNEEVRSFCDDDLCGKLIYYNDRIRKKC
ncbi:MAG: hypothetical protein A3G49_00590 [Candidatus Sungbacteria bacterium RIFCSPLOWO2_12_FULL_41_11]|uniref:Uncharacterized protein n=1 Tax=Candidatus Sungbacteria bacterium RIFCSPLOWO2_12_FULL_41_11 TaxID=1802286 RepID=A0A1G2LMZ0_9BACT|nr:MAG: hypothetical protein UV01_C0009G0018 [Parcubacteria group bacterium GW2011_GWA2_42_14]OGZ99460.1 MAG: hypothetical protein A3D41_00845 [Candidatus Sungbacteria bacterium RIFCSPHIGHO2_02_FULL_41_12b]OHA12980.1 MAG: hypothetical protein A3G49_00590 [Candidatus Sungbacteria bacterium RIFCSPLOWO2_12_FULL_41_11]